MGEPFAYFISFRTYGTWLHGDARGSMNRFHNRWGEPCLEANEDMVRAEQERMKGPPFEMNDACREVVAKTVREVCAHRGWTIHALNVRGNHVHTVVMALQTSPEKVMNDFKAWSTRRLREGGLAGAAARVWSRHGSTPHLYTSESLLGAIDYVLNCQ
jgi:REP element-mobilizing transposase RayT